MKYSHKEMSKSRQNYQWILPSFQGRNDSNLIQRLKKTETPKSIYIKKKNIYSWKNAIKRVKSKSQGQKRHLPIKMGNTLNIHRIPMNWSKIIKHPIENWEKELKTCNSKKYIQMFSKGVRKCLISLVVMVKKIIETIMTYHYSPTSMAKQKI